MKKQYRNKNVYEASMERIDFVFKNFEKIYLSFSGGKDSSVMFHLVMDYMKTNNIQKKIAVMFIDLEAQYSSTINHILEMMEEYKSLIEPYWICLPFNLRNAVSVYQPFWTPWGQEDRKQWVREYPNYPIINEENNPFPFFKKHMEFEEFVVEFGKWYSNGEKTACLVGIRADESLNRTRTIFSNTKTTEQKQQWTTKVSENLFNCYPIYDWKVEDIWVANGKFAWKYNKIYDLFYMAGVPLSKQRICQPYGDDQKIGLNLFRVVENDTWVKVVSRVAGANFGNIYCGTFAIGYQKTKLPPGHTWKSYTKYLLSSLSEDMRNHYKDRFIKFIRHWNKIGSPFPDNIDLPPGAVEIEPRTKRLTKRRRHVIFKKIPDFLDGKYESEHLAPTWRRMAKCIIKNDHLCKGLSFSQTKEQRKQIVETLEKYRSVYEKSSL